MVVAPTKVKVTLRLSTENRPALSRAGLSVSPSGLAGGVERPQVPLSRLFNGFLDSRRILYATPTADQITRFWFEVKLALADTIDGGSIFSGANLLDCFHRWTSDLM